MSVQKGHAHAYAHAHRKLGMIGDGLKCQCVMKGNRGILYFSVTKLEHILTRVTYQLRFIHSLT